VFTPSPPSSKRNWRSRFFDTPYYVTPNEPVAQEAFAVIREAMPHKAMAALGRLVLAKRERVIALEPYDKGLLGTTLRYPYEVRDAAITSATCRS
jgi:DNA end-binding protein Ku